MTCIHFLQCFYQRIRALRRRDLFQHRFPPGAERERDCPQGLRVQKEIHDGGGCGSRSAGCKLRCKLMSWKMVVFNGKTIYQLWIYPIDFSKIT